MGEVGAIVGTVTTMGTIILKIPIHPTTGTITTTIPLIITIMGTILGTTTTQGAAMDAGAPPSHGGTTMAIPMTTVRAMTMGRVPGAILQAGTVDAQIFRVLNSILATPGLIKHAE